MIRRGRDEEPYWHPVLGVLWEHERYEDRLDALLARVAAESEVRAAYLYLLDEQARHLRLERAWVPQEAVQAAVGAAPRRAGGPSSLGPAGVTTLPGPDSGTTGFADDDGGAASSAATPPLEVPWDTLAAQPRIASTPAGRLFSVPLLAGERPVGVIQVGPLPKADVPGKLRRKVTELARPVALVAERAVEEQRLRARLGALGARVEAGRRLQGTALEADRFLELLLGLALRATRSEAGFVAVLEDGRLAIRVSRRLPDQFVAGVDLDPDGGWFDWSLAELGGALVLRDVDATRKLGVSGVLAVPLVDEGERLGMVALVNFTRSGVFDAQALALLETFSDQIRLMLQNARLFQTFSERYLETMRGLARSLDARRPHLRDHHRLVADVAGALAAEAGQPPDFVDAVRTAGLVHDVGTAGLVEAGAWSDTDHPVIGASMVEYLPLDSRVGEAVANHHEWFDGWGFPNGRRGEEIPLAGRILGAAEFVAEMAAGDPTRPQWPVERIVAELRQRRESQFDPVVVEAADLLASRGALLPWIPEIG